ERRLAAVSRHADRENHALRPVLHLCRDHPAGTPGSVVRVRSRARGLRRQLRPAATGVRWRHLSGVSRTLSAETQFMNAREASTREKKRQPLSVGSEWTFDLIQTYDREIGRLAKRYGLETYPNQIEVITAEQMMDAYASVGMPIGYHHWSYGKHFLATEKGYTRGQMGLAYEIVINSDPC